MEIRINTIFLHVLPALRLKLDEFDTIYNYKEITEEELWDYCLNNKFKHDDIEKQSISKVIKVIFDISMLDIIHYKQVLDDCSRGYFGKLSEEEINFLLGSFRSVRGLKAYRKLINVTEKRVGDN